MKSFEFKLYMTEAFFSFLFLIPLLLVSIILNKYGIIFTYIFGVYITLLSTLLLIYTNTWLVNYRLRTIKFNYKKRYKWMAFGFFLSRMMLYTLAVAIVIIFQNYFDIVIIFIPLSLKTLSSFWAGYFHTFDCKKREEMIRMGESL